MLTRSQVARRIGKSLATVRRIEGVLLHPVQDAHGVHRFDADEVDRLAEGLLEGSVSLWAELQGRDPDQEGNSGLLSRRCATAEAKAAQLQRENRVWRDVISRLCAFPGMKERVLEIAKAISSTS